MIAIKKIVILSCLLLCACQLHAQNVKTNNPDKVTIADPNASAPATKVTLASGELSTEVKLMSSDNKVISENINQPATDQQKATQEQKQSTTKKHADKKR